MDDNRLLEVDCMLRYGVGSELEYETYKPVFSNKAGNSVGAKEVMPLVFSLGKFTDEGNHVSKRSSHPSSQVSIWSKKNTEIQGERGSRNSKERKKMVLWKRALQFSHLFFHSPQSFLLAIQIILNFILRIISIQSVQFSCSVMSDSLYPMNHSMSGLPFHHQLPESTQIHVHWVDDTIQPSHLLSSPSPPALNLSQHQGLFQWVSSSHQMAKVLGFQLQHQSFQSRFRTDFLRINWLNLLVVQATLRSLLQHHSSKAAIFQRSAFFIVQLSHPYMTTGKTKALTRRTFVDKVMYLLFHNAV